MFVEFHLYLIGKPIDFCSGHVHDNDNDTAHGVISLLLQDQPSILDETTKPSRVLLRLINFSKEIH